MLCYVMLNLFTVGSIQFPNAGTIALLEANQNRHTQHSIEPALRNTNTFKKLTFTSPEKGITESP